jgi:hypothetical protein
MDSKSLVLRLWELFCTVKLHLELDIFSRSSKIIGFSSKQASRNQRQRGSSVMGPSATSTQENQIVIKFGPDFSALAYRAASELDILSLGFQDMMASGKRLEAVKELRDELRKIEQMRPSDFKASSSNDVRAILHPSTVVVMDRVISILSKARPLKLTELVKQTGIYVKLLDSVIEDPIKFKEKNSADLEKLVDFCLTLSEEVFDHRRSTLELRTLRKPEN